MWWQEAIRAGKALRVLGVSGDDLDALTEIDAPNSPIVVGLCPPESGARARTIVDLVAGELQNAVLNLYPTWLSAFGDAGLTADRGSLGVAAAVAIARRMSKQTTAYSPFVVDLARSAASNTQPRSEYPTDIRLSGLADLLRRSYGRDDIVIVVTADYEVTDRAAAIGSAAEWLAHAGRLTVWLVGPEFDQLTRIPCINLRCDRGATATAVPSGSPDTATASAAITLTPFGGRPAANSAAEQFLERALAREPWASERVWNRGVDGLDALAQPIRVDLQWRYERIIVELDGADHRAPQKYAADRLRDNLLQFAGYMVLRYPNERVLDDVGAVVTELREVVRARSD